MDLRMTLRELHVEHDCLNRLIAMLEGLVRRDEPNAQQPRSRRGRKSMGKEEREQVSARMKKYWASLRKPS